MSLSSSIDWENVPSGNYLVRGDSFAVLRSCRTYGQVRVFSDPQELTQLGIPLPGQRFFYLYPAGNQLPSTLPTNPPPPDSYRLVIGGDKTNYKSPPKGYQYLDARCLGRWEPAVEYAKRCPYKIPTTTDEDLCRRLLESVIALNVKNWHLPTNLCYRLFGSEAESYFFKKALKCPTAYAIWECLEPDWELKPRVALYGAALVFLQRKQKALKRWHNIYLFNPRLDPELGDLLGWPKVKADIIEGGLFCQNNTLKPLELIKEHRQIQL